MTKDCENIFILMHNEKFNSIRKLIPKHAFSLICLFQIHCHISEKPIFQTSDI